MVKIDAGLAVVLAAVCSLISATVVAIITARSQNSKIINEIREVIKLLNYRLDQVETKVTVHNNFDTRIVKLEERYSSVVRLEEIINTILQKLGGAA